MGEALSLSTRRTGLRPSISKTSHAAESALCHAGFTYREHVRALKVGPYWDSHDPPPEAGLARREASSGYLAQPAKEGGPRGKHGFPRAKAEGEGFEPSTDLTARNGFRDRRIRPLCHPSEVAQSSG